jgi:hypothetical protein
MRIGGAGFHGIGESGSESARTGRISLTSPSLHLL